jgi:hypothetical protein
MITILWGLLAAAPKILYGILAAAGAIAAAWKLGKSSGAKEKEAEQRIDQLERTNEALITRTQVSANVRDLDDDDLERLRQQYERPDVANELRGVGSDQDQQERQLNPTDTRTNKHP